MGQQPQKVAWAKCGRGPAPGGLVPPPTKAQGAGRVGGGKTLGPDGLKAHPRAPPSLPHLGRTLDGFLGAAATPREGTLDGGAAPPLPLYILEVRGLQHT